jgi:hypothetical protein
MGEEYDFSNAKPNPYIKKLRKQISIIDPNEPYTEEKKSEWKIGILDGKVKIEFRDDFEMTPEELLGIK